MYKLKVKLLTPTAKAPTVAHPGEDLAYDLYASEKTTIWPGRVCKVKTGIAVSSVCEILKDRLSRGGLIIKDRSSMAAQGIFTHAGVVDSGYTGEIVVLMTSLDHATILPGDKIAQMIPVSIFTGVVEVVEELAVSERGAKGFGSSGR